MTTRRWHKWFGSSASRQEDRRSRRRALRGSFLERLDRRSLMAADVVPAVTIEDPVEVDDAAVVAEPATEDTADGDFAIAICRIQVDPNIEEINLLDDAVPVDVLYMVDPVVDLEQIGGADEGSSDGEVTYLERSIDDSEVDPIVFETMAGSVAYSWNNASVPEDVNGDQVITPLDALILLSALNDFGATTTSELDTAFGATPSAKAHFDVNGDAYVSAIDALMLLNYLNNASTGGTDAAGFAALAPQVQKIRPDYEEDSGFVSIATDEPLVDDADESGEIKQDDSGIAAPIGMLRVMRYDDGSNDESSDKIDDLSGDDESEDENGVPVAWW
ncbi:MAG: dockerin type I domain-containing protein [Pirellulales bacterium]